MRENLKNKHRIKNVIWSDKTVMHEAERPSIFFFFFFYNSFTYYQAEQIKKGVICVQIRLE